MGYFSLNPFNKIFRLIFRKESKTKLKIRTESSQLNLSTPDEVKLQITICCLLSIILTQTVGTDLKIRTYPSPRLALQIVEEASGSEEVAYNFITADMKYIITADGKIFYVKDGV